MIESRPIGLSIAILKEAIVSAVTSLDSERMANWTPILLGPRSDFARIRDGTIEIGTEITVEPLNSIQISELMTI